jgi:hypothetical protein
MVHKIIYFFLLMVKLPFMISMIMEHQTNDESS